MTPISQYQANNIWLNDGKSIIVFNKKKKNCNFKKILKNKNLKKILRV